MDMKKSLTILVPTFNEEQNLNECVSVISRLQNSIEKELGISVEVSFLDNHSTDNTFELLKSACRNNNSWTAIRLIRNYGVQASLLKGMAVASTDGLLVYQSDLQDPPEIAFKLAEEWLKGGRVIAGIASKRAEKWMDRTTRKIFYSILKNSSDFGLTPWFHDFYLLDKVVYKSLFRQGFEHEFIRGRISEEFGIDKSISYTRNIRTEGVSSFNFARKYSMALDGILRYGNRFSRIVSMGSLFLSLFTLLSAIILLLTWIFGIRSPSQGWLSLFFANLFLLTLSSFSLSLSSEFFFRILRLSGSKLAPEIEEQC